jgi:hypothetical protein
MLAVTIHQHQMGPARFILQATPGGTERAGFAGFAWVGPDFRPRRAGLRGRAIRAVIGHHHHTWDMVQSAPNHRPDGGFLIPGGDEHERFHGENQRENK